MAFLSIFLAILILVGFDVSVSVFIRDFLLADESFMGLSIGLVGVGTLIATMLLLTRKTKNDHWRDVVAALALLAVIPLSLTLSIYFEKPEIRPDSGVGGMSGGWNWKWTLDMSR